MKNKITLNESEICEEYLNSKIGVEAMALKYHVGKKKIKEILVKNNIAIKSRGAQSNNETFVVSDWSIEKYSDIEGKHYIAIDEKTGFTTKDYKNKGGVMTTYIEKEYGIETPTLYDRRMYYMRTGNYWWEQWFTIQSVDNAETKKCPYCDWETVDLENNSGAFSNHLQKAHGITIMEYLDEHPEDAEYFRYANNVLNIVYEKDESKYVVCPICGQRMKHIGGKHLQTHGITMDEFMEKFPNTKIITDEYRDFLSKKAIEMNANADFVKHSKPEMEVTEYIESLGFKVECNRKILHGKEIDIFIPSLNIGFEYDGLVWHDERYKSRGYHLDKTKDCLENGVRLYHIFEDEWLLKKDIVKSRIANILGKVENRIYARKCYISVVDTTEARDFLKHNHLQGEIDSNIRYGLYYNGELMSLMTFGNVRKNLGRTATDGEYELLRFCNKVGYSVIGGASRLFQYFIDNNEWKKVVTYADKRWSFGDLYHTLGFEHKHDSSPNYFYVVNGRKRDNRYKYRKDELVRQGFDTNKSEHEIMLERGIYRIYDCGSMVFEMTNKQTIF